ncbi:MAG: cobalamin-binding protein [Bacteroidetes bacterium HGW-Bacteroidetes-10]|jgi:methanogenic corrinoid protein MtbC1|nr:MAG: cobalamin-binding protein [Bacteroidetes bacterium HGW-Bacteroidetes-10]
MNNQESTGELLAFLLKGERQGAANVVNGLLESGEEVQHIYEMVIKPAMYRVGEMWEEGEISVATEHLASAIVETILGQLYYKVISKSGSRNRTVVVSTVENESHQIGAKMVSDVFELHGWNSHFLGANTPVDELFKYIEMAKPDMLSLSMSIDSHLESLERAIVKVREKYPDLVILIGGQGLNKNGGEVMLRYSGVLYFRDLGSFENFLLQS